VPPSFPSAMLSLWFPGAPAVGSGVSTLEVGGGIEAGLMLDQRDRAWDQDLRPCAALNS